MLTQFHFSALLLVFRLVFLLPCTLSYFIYPFFDALNMIFLFLMVDVICLQNVGPHFETWNAGVLGPVSLNGLNEGRRDLSWQKWSYKVCVEHLCFFVSWPSYAKVLFGWSGWSKRRSSKSSFAQWKFVCWVGQRIIDGLGPTSDMVQSK